MIRAQILTTANTKYGDEFVFGGTRQDIPPFDPSTAVPAATPTTSQYIQIEPGSNAIASGVTADSLFSDAASSIFTDLDAAIAALRGTGDPVADKATLEATNSRLVIYDDQLNTARIRVGANMNVAELVKERLTGHSTAYNEMASSIEGADFVETAVGLSQAQQALEATLQVTATRRRTLFDYLG
jgi:flagellin-like hook-associated protein FlgL